MDISNSGTMLFYWRLLLICNNHAILPRKRRSGFAVADLGIKKVIA
jgi:hypothetical protein